MDNMTLDGQIPKLVALMVLLLTILITINAPGRAHASDLTSSVQEESDMEYVPVQPTEYRVFEYEGNTTADTSGRVRRNLKAFRLCSSCKCCARGNPKSCQTMKCCYGIKCNLPNKPFGTCAFMPMACDCKNCS